MFVALQGVGAERVRCGRPRWRHEFIFVALQGFGAERLEFIFVGEVRDIKLHGQLALDPKRGARRRTPMNASPLKSSGRDARAAVNGGAVGRRALDHAAELGAIRPAPAAAEERAAQPAIGKRGAAASVGFVEDARQNRSCRNRGATA